MLTCNVTANVILMRGGFVVSNTFVTILCQIRSNCTKILYSIYTLLFVAYLILSHMERRSDKKLVGMR